MKLIIQGLLLCVLALQGTVANANEHFSYSLEPEQCVTMEQGQACYVDIEVTWQSATPLNICLYLSDAQLQCWRASKAGEFHGEIQMTTDQPLVLSTDTEQKAKSIIRYAWVYKQSKRKAARWRLF